MKRVRIDSMKRGDRFVAVGDGKVWRFERKDGALSGAYHCTREADSFASCFAGCAEGDLIVAGTAPIVGDPDSFDVFEAQKGGA